MEKYLPALPFKCSSVVIWKISFVCDSLLLQVFFFFLICAKTAAGDGIPADVLTKNVFLLYYFYLLIEIYLIFL